MAYVERTSRRLSRSIFHAMMRYQAALEKKQSTLARIVDIGTDLFAMSATISYAHMLAEKGGQQANAVEMADLFCRDAKVRIEKNFETMFDNHDAFAYRQAQKLLRGDYDWMQGDLVERGHIGVHATPEAIEKAIAALER